ncbi:MAG: hypothetical protein HFH68_05140 [Lachnospiraceae bacterium]|nr:hypothetical protein [Lachnospiraceae bacterium]
MNKKIFVTGLCLLVVCALAGRNYTSKDDGVIEKNAAPEDEIQGFFDDGSMLLVQNHNTIYQLNNFHTDNKTILLQKENIYQTIMHNDELLVCTMDDYGLIEVFIYSFASGKLTKTANANAIPLDFNKGYVICGEEGTGMTELINRNTGEFESIVINDAEEELSLEENAISDDELDELFKIVTRYYQKKLSWEIVDYRIAGNDHSFYQLYKDYGLGNIIVFEVHTTDNPSGLYRSIALGRKKNHTKWEVLNEGV